MTTTAATAMTATAQKTTAMTKRRKWKTKVGKDKKLPFNIIFFYFSVQFNPGDRNTATWQNDLVFKSLREAFFYFPLKIFLPLD